MLTVEAAFDRINSALRQRGYSLVREEKSTDASGDRTTFFTSPTMSVRVSWNAKVRMMCLHVDADGGWVEFARRNFGPKGLEDTSVDALVRAIRNEVAETSTDSD
jgi:hypothetical protein